MQRTVGELSTKLNLNESSATRFLSHFTRPRSGTQYGDAEEHFGSLLPHELLNFTF